MISLSPKEAVEYEMAGCREHLSLFIEKTFEIVDPSTQYLHNWHIDCISEHLEACHRREIKRLLITIPPRYMKSISCNVAFPAWVLGHNPSEKILSASYSLDLSLKHSVDCRLMMQSDWYKSCFPGTRIADDQNEKSKFITTKRGQRIATSVGGTVTGEGANILILDDIHSALQAQSEVIRESQIEWISQSFLSRLNDKKNGVIIGVMQKLHLADAATFLLKQGGYIHVNLPAIAPNNKTISIGKFYKEIKTGDILHPEREDAKMLAVLRRQMGESTFSAQYLQNPVPDGGGIIKQKWFELWPANKKLPSFVYVMQIWDTAFTEKVTGDPSGVITLGVFFPEEEDRENLQTVGGGFAVMLIDCENEHLGFPALRKKMIEMRSYRYGEREKAVDMVLVEDKASGQSIIQELRNANLPVKAFKVGRMDKTARLHSISHFIENGLFYIPESTKRPGEFRDWAMEFVNQVCSFPAAEHDEMVDCLSSAMITLSQMTFLRMDSIAEEIDEDRSDPHASNNVSNPYGS